MRLLHTADWHLGQTFYEYDRAYEHEQFLKWLILAIKENDVDVLLMCGDVFDVSNPSAASVSLFYTFLKEAVLANPSLQIIIIAGNHDSPSRLEAPKPLLEAFNIRIIGVVNRNEDGELDYGNLVIPIKDPANETVAWCMAIPFLRNGDYPVIAGAGAPYTEGVTALYKEVLGYTFSQQQPGQAIIAIGHLHTSGSDISKDDKSERLIMGGAELIPASAFDEGIAYTALGHIHKPQKIGGKEHIRYSGSPIPMSFSELNYKHQVVLVDIEGGKVKAIQPLYIPVTVGLIKVPQVPRSLNDVLEELRQLPGSICGDVALAPYLEVRVLLDGPEPSLRHKIDKALENKYVRLARINVQYPVSQQAETETLSIEQLNNLEPADVFKKAFQSKYKNDPATELVQFFDEIVAEINLA